MTKFHIEFTVDEKSLAQTIIELEKVKDIEDMAIRQAGPRSQNPIPRQKLPIPRQKLPIPRQNSPRNVFWDKQTADRQRPLRLIIDGKETVKSIILAEVGANSPMRAPRLAHIMVERKFSGHSVNSAVINLERRGLLRRTEPGTYVLTADGQAALEKINA